MPICNETPTQDAVQFTPNLRGIAGRKNDLRKAGTGRHRTKRRPNRGRNRRLRDRDRLLRGQQNPEAAGCRPDAACGRR